VHVQGLAWRKTAKSAKSHAVRLEAILEQPDDPQGQGCPAVMVPVSPAKDMQEELEEENVVASADERREKFPGGQGSLEGHWSPSGVLTV